MQDLSTMIVTRRRVLGLFGAAGAVSLVGLRGRSRSWAATCAASPAETEGPYFVDERLERSDIRVDPSDGSVQPGVPLELQLNVVQADADCAPASGVQVDVWHASATGVYSDEAAIGSSGEKFLRGYQTTDANGAVTFVTVYPGWYSGRTIHVHVKIRTFSGSTTTYEFTSQVYFDDTVTDQVLATSSYDARGARDTTNADDTIYDGTLLLALTGDGNGGYVGTFTIGVTGLPGGSSGGTTCASLGDCRTAVTNALPDPSSSADRHVRRVARRLARLATRIDALLDRAVTASGDKQTRLYRKARTLLARLVDQASIADTNGTLGVSLATLEAAVSALVALFPST
jgi:protocatechuate 3,4-dioxygenase beta subunit